jgi:protein-disulfide isomerase
VLEKYPKDVKVVFMSFPLSSHPYARIAAAAALAAGRQGKFWEFHHKLFENFRDLTPTKIQEIAKGLNLDMDKYNRDMRDPAIQNLIARDIKEGYEAGVQGTPTVFVNGRVLRKRSLEGFSELIQKALKK